MTNEIPIRETAFVRYLLSLPRHKAIAHMITCLRGGDSENAAWDLMEEVNGEWVCARKKLPAFIGKTLDKIKEDS